MGVRVEGKILVAVEEPIRVALLVAQDQRSAHPPQQRRLFSDRWLAPREVCDLGGVSMQVAFHERGLFEEVAERMSIPEALHACRDRQWVSHENDDLHVEGRRQSLGREDRERVLQQRTRTDVLIAHESPAVAHDPGDGRGFLIARSSAPSE